MEIVQLLKTAPPRGDVAARRPDPPPGFDRAMDEAVRSTAPPPPEPDGESPPRARATPRTGEGAMPTPPNADGPTPDPLPTSTPNVGGQSVMGLPAPLRPMAVWADLLPVAPPQALGLPPMHLSPDFATVPATPMGPLPLGLGRLPLDGLARPELSPDLQGLPTFSAPVVPEFPSAKALGLVAQGPRVDQGTLMLSADQQGLLKPSLVASVVSAPPTPVAPFDVFAAIESRSAGFSLTVPNLTSPSAALAPSPSLGQPVVVPADAPGSAFVPGANGVPVGPALTASQGSAGGVRPPVIDTETRSTDFPLLSAPGASGSATALSGTPTSSASLSVLSPNSPASSARRGTVATTQTAPATEAAPKLASSPERVASTASAPGVVSGAVTGAVTSSAQRSTKSISGLIAGTATSLEEIDEDVLGLEPSATTAVTGREATVASPIARAEALSVKAPAVEPEPLVRQILERIDTLAEAQPGRTVRVVLNPDDLGVVTVTLRQVAGRTEAELSASHDPVRAALEAHKTQLVVQAEQRGIQLGTVQVNATSQSQATLAGGQGQAGHGQADSGSPQDAARLAHLAQGTTLPTDATRTSFRTGRAAGVDLVI